MSVAAIYVLHYGVQWLKWSMRSVRDMVDDIYVFYSSTPSHGHNTSVKCPEKREDLIEVAKEFGVRWIDCGPFEHEGKHRDFSVDKVKGDGYSQALIVDADEIWDASHLSSFIQFGRETPSRSIRVAMNHFWRSCKWYCKDDASPLRLFNFSYSGGESYYPLDGTRVYHMGYAQTPSIIDYKLKIHGHKNEIRDNWFSDVFMPWQPGKGNVHPCGDGSQWRNVLPYIDDGSLDILIGDHPFWGVDIIS